MCLELKFALISKPETLSFSRDLSDQVETNSHQSLLLVLNALNV